MDSSVEYSRDGSAMVFEKTECMTHHTASSDRGSKQEKAAVLAGRIISAVLGFL